MNLAPSYALRSLRSKTKKHLETDISQKSASVYLRWISALRSLRSKTKKHLETDISQKSASVYLRWISALRSLRSLRSVGGAGFEPATPGL